MIDPKQITETADDVLAWLLMATDIELVTALEECDSAIYYAITHE